MSTQLFSRTFHLLPPLTQTLASISPLLLGRTDLLSSLSHTSRAAVALSFRQLSTKMGSQQEFYALSADTLQGKPFDFSQLQGKVVLIVNVASQCGFTPQYKGLQALHEKYADKGLVILGFPCNQFGGQEPGGESEITVCQRNHGVSFPIMAKVDVNGDNAHPVFKFLKKEKKQLMMELIKWNFEKFLIGKDGTVVKRFSSVATPASMEPDIEALL